MRRIWVALVATSIGLLLLSGCQMLSGNSPSSTGVVTLNPATVTFGSVKVGSNQKTTVTISNSGTADLVVNQAALSGAGFTMGNLALPMTLHAGNSTSASITFAPPSSGSFSGSVTFATTATNGNVSLPLAGTGTTAGNLVAAPTSLTFGSIPVGTSTSQSETITNSGGASVTISQATLSGAGLSLSGLSLPVTLASNQSVTFKIVFAPSTAGAVNGSVAITSDANAVNVGLSGTGLAAQGQITPNPTSLSFGSVATGSSKSLSGTLTNSGGTSVTISAASASGSGFTLSGLSVPVTLSAGQSKTFSVLFAPAVTGSVSGSLTVTSNGSNPNLSIALTGSGAAPGSLSANPTSLAFGNVQVGSTTSKSETVTNTGGATVTISQVNVTGTGYSVSGLTLPTTLAAGQSVTFTVKFAPSTAATVNGNLSLVSDASNSPLGIALAGTGTTPGQLSLNPTSLNFGNVTVGSKAALSGTLTASSAAVTISSASANSSEFMLSGITLPTTLAAGQSVAFTVTFAPQTTGTATASLTFTSNATNAPTTQSLTGSGTAAAHSVSLSWSASSGAVGYNVYRGGVSGGPYAIINTSLDALTSYTDTTVAAGTTYYYVVTAVDSSSNESGYSNQATAVVPSP